MSSVLRSSRQIPDLVPEAEAEEEDEVRSLQANIWRVWQMVHRPLKGGDSKDYIYVFKGMDATALACQKAQALNQAEGRSALAA